MGTLSIGSSTLNVVPGTNITVNNNYGLTFGVTTLTGDATFHVANNGTATGTVTIGVIGQTGGSHALTKTGPGRLVLAGTANTYSGNTTITGGTLALGATGVISNSPLIDVRAGGTLDVSAVTSGFILQTTQTLTGNGTVAGNVTAHGTLSPGNSIGTLNHLGNLVLTGTAVLNYELGASNDLIAATGNLTLDGTLNITDAGGFGVGTYPLISYTGSLTNNGLEIGTTPNPSLTYTIDVGTAGLVKLKVTGDPFVAWQNQYFPGGGPNAAANADPDGDGMSNTNEFLAGTIPTNSASAFRILDVTPTNTGMKVTWLTHAGITNILQAVPDLSGSYTDVSPSLIITGDTNSDTVITNYTEPGAATNMPSRYYRVRFVP